MLTNSAVIEVFQNNAHRYTDAAGTTYRAARPDDLTTALRERGWKNLGRLDIFDYKKLGFQIVTARYTQGARPGRPCDVVVLEKI